MNSVSLSVQASANTCSAARAVRNNADTIEKQSRNTSSGEMIMKAARSITRRMLMKLYAKTGLDMARRLLNDPANLDDCISETTLMIIEGLADGWLCFNDNNRLEAIADYANDLECITALHNVFLAPSRYLRKYKQRHYKHSYNIIDIDPETGKESYEMITRAMREYSLSKYSDEAWEAVYALRARLSVEDMQILRLLCGERVSVQFNKQSQGGGIYYKTIPLTIAEVCRRSGKSRAEVMLVKALCKECIIADESGVFDGIRACITNDVYTPAGIMRAPRKRKHTRARATETIRGGSRLHTACIMAFDSRGLRGWTLHDYANGASIISEQENYFKSIIAPKIERYDREQEVMKWHLL